MLSLLVLPRFKLSRCAVRVQLTSPPHKFGEAAATKTDLHRGSPFLGHSRLLQQNPTNFFGPTEQSTHLLRALYVSVLAMEKTSLFMLPMTDIFTNDILDRKRSRVVQHWPASFLSSSKPGWSGPSLDALISHRERMPQCVQHGSLKVQVCHASFCRFGSSSP